MRFLSLRSVALLSFAVSSLSAQSTPPQYVQIFREEVKMGRVNQHAVHEAGWPRAFAKAKTPNYYLALTTMFGPAEAWFLEGHPSFAALDSANKAVEKAPGLTAELDRLHQGDAANVNNTRTLLAMYIPDLSNAGGITPPEARAWEVTIFRVRPGRDEAFASAAKLYMKKVQEAGVSTPWAVYYVLAGMPGPTFLVFAPRRSFVDLDPINGPGAAIEKAIMSDEAARKQFATAAEGYISVESLIFAPSPAMSYLPADFIAQDTKYWSAKAPAATQAGAPRGQDRKP